MSRINVENIRHPDASSDSLQLSDTGNITAPGNLSVTGTSTLTGNVSASGNLSVTGTSTLTGNTVVTGSLTANGLAYPSAGPLSNRNLIINGAMQLAQRSTSSVTVSNGNSEGYSTVDRWFLNFNDAIGGAVSFAQSSDSPAGFANSVSITCSVTDTSFATNQYLALQQKIEAQNLQLLSYGSSDAVSMTLSWYMKTTTYTGPISVSLFTDDGTVEYFTVSVTPTTSWARYTLTIPGSTTATINNDTGIGMYLQFVLAGNTSSSIASSSDSTAWSTTRADFRDNVGNILSSTSNAFFLTGVQLEVGSVATPFEHRSYGQELALCRRYYYKIQATRGNQSGFFANSHNRSTTSALGVTPFPVEMRTGPTALEQSGTASDYQVNHGNTQTACSSVPAWFDADIFAARTNFTTAGSLTTGQGSILRSASTDAFLAWSAEL